MIPDWVKQYIGLPFEVCNCWQLICRVYRDQLAIRLPFLDDQYADPFDREAISKLYETVLAQVWLRTDTPELLTAAVFRMQGQLWHVGLVITKDTMLHTHPKIDSSLERFNNKIWAHRIEGFYKYVG
jgi:hypothetical protein